MNFQGLIWHTKRSKMLPSDRVVTTAPNVNVYNLKVKISSLGYILNQKVTNTWNKLTMDFVAAPSTGVFKTILDLCLQSLTPDGARKDKLGQHPTISPLLTPLMSN